MMIAGGPLVLTFAEADAATGRECQNRTTRARRNIFRNGLENA